MWRCQVAFKSNIDDQIRGFWFAASGNDAFDGATLERAKKTIQAAINAANALTPIPSSTNTAQVAASQGGVFLESFVLSEGIQFDGPNIIVVADAVVAITLDSFLSCLLTAASNSQDNSTVFLIDGLFSVGLDTLSCTTNGDNSIGIEIKGSCDRLFISSSQMRINGTGSVGIEYTGTSPKPVDINHNTVTLEDPNTTYIDWNPLTADDNGSVNASAVVNGSTGTVGFRMRQGRLKVMLSEVHAETAINATGGILHLLSNTVVGDIFVGSGASVTVMTGCLSGDITVDAGGILTILALSDSGITITNNGTLNGIISGVYFGTYRQKPLQEFLLTGSSFNTQSPIGTDNPLKVEFGAAQFGPSDPVEIDVLGNITINQTDQYLVDFLFHAGRTGAGSFAVLLFRLLINGIQVGDSLAIRLDNANTHFPVEISEPLNLIATDVLTVEIWRDPSGFNAGSLFDETPTLSGSNPVPSAAIIITRYRLTQPI